MRTTRLSYAPFNTSNLSSATLILVSYSSISCSSGLTNYCGSSFRHLNPQSEHSYTVVEHPSPWSSCGPISLNDVCDHLESPGASAGIGCSGEHRYRLFAGSFGQFMLKCFVVILLFPHPFYAFFSHNRILHLQTLCLLPSRNTISSILCSWTSNYTWGRLIVNKNFGVGELPYIPYNPAKIWTWTKWVKVTCAAVTLRGCKIPRTGFEPASWGWKPHILT